MYRTGGAVDTGYNNTMRIDDPPVIIADTAPGVEPPTSTSTPSKSSDMHQSVHPMQPSHQPMISGIQQSLPSMQPAVQPNSLPHNPTYPQPTFSSQPSSYSGLFIIIFFVNSH